MSDMITSIGLAGMLTNYETILTAALTFVVATLGYKLIKRGTSKI